MEVAVVVGGGNFFRGINAWDGLERATADYMGMLATCMNAICLQVLSVSLGSCTAPTTPLQSLPCVGCVRWTAGSVIPGLLTYVVS